MIYLIMHKEIRTFGKFHVGDKVNFCDAPVIIRAMRPVAGGVAVDVEYVDIALDRIRRGQVLTGFTTAISNLCAP